MKFSHQWLQELSKMRMQPEKMAEVLTMHAFETTVGQKVGSDQILDIDVLPNRAIEGYSHVSVTRELSAIKGKKLSLPKPFLKEDKKLASCDVANITVKDKNLCPRYAARVISGVKVKESPVWLKRRLQTLGLNSINNIVDATNYVMLELGQPLHAFDFDKIASPSLKLRRASKNKRQIIIRQAKRHEKVTTLDGQRLELPKGALLITDPKKILAIAGIKGAIGSEISSKTKTIILEAANFNSVSIRQTSRILGLITDASIRFSQNLSPDLVGTALDRVAELIKKLAGGIIYQGRVEVYPRKLTPQKIFIDMAKMQSLLGAKVSASQAGAILGHLGFAVEKINPYKQVSKVVELAKQLVGRKYQYGASTTFDAPEKFDCSSLVKYLYRQIGFELPRISIEQAEVGKQVSLKNLQPGDLVFTNGSKTHFNDKFKKGVGHVALYIGNGKVVHASGKGKKAVAVAPLKKVATAKEFRIARRIIDENHNRDSLLVSVPTTRFSLNQNSVWQDVDVIEEVGRIIGYQKIKPVLPKHVLTPTQIPEHWQWQELIRSSLAGLGFSEMYAYGFVGEQDTQIFKMNRNNLIQVANPLSEDLKYLRPSLMPTLLKSVHINQRFFDGFKVFELGKIYGRDVTRAALVTTRAALVQEKLMLAGVIAGVGKANESFYELKGVVESLLEKLGITDYWFDSAKATPDDSPMQWWQMNQAAEIKVGNKEIGFLGVLNPKLCQELDIKMNLVAFDINFAKLLEQATAERRYKEPVKFPAITRDLSVMTADAVKVDEILNVIETAGGPLLAGTDVIDIYEGGKELPEGQQSVTFRLVFQSEEKTLKDEEVNGLMKKIEKAIREQGWSVR